MPFHIIRQDITKVKTDAIVNTANPRPVIGSGTDSAIYEAAGKEKLLAAREKVGDIAPGNSEYTPTFGLPAKYTIHSAGTFWQDGLHGEWDILRSCYRSALSLAMQLNCKSIAFPLMATGAYGFPKAEALDVALQEIGHFRLKTEARDEDMEIYLVVFDKQALELSGNEFKEIQQFIDDSYVTEQRTHEYLSDSQAMRRFHSELQHTSVYPRTEKKNVFDLTVEGVNRYISSNKGESFADTLIKYVNASEMGAQSAGRDLFSGSL